MEILTENLDDVEGISPTRDIVDQGDDCQQCSTADCTPTNVSQPSTVEDMEHSNNTITQQKGSTHYGACTTHQLTADTDKNHTKTGQHRERESLLTGQSRPTAQLQADPIFTHPSCCPQIHGVLNWNPRVRCIKNILLNSIASFLVFTPFMAFQSMDSTLNARAGLGVIAFSVLYTGFILSCILAPAVVRYVGCKEAMLMCFILHLVFTLSHLYSQFYTLLPSSLLLGLTLGPFWTAQGVYITSVSAEYSSLTGKEYGRVLSQFSGVFNFFILSSQKFGNLLESAILSRQIRNGTLPDPGGEGVLLSTDVNSNMSIACGAAFCGVADAPSITSGGTLNTYVLLAIFTAFCLTGITLNAGFVDGISRTNGQHPTVSETDTTRPPEVTSTVTFDVNLSDALVIHKKNYMYLLVPLLFYNGLQQGFVYGDYTEAFVACSLGVEYIGYAMLVYGYADAFMSLLVGWLERYTGRVALFTSAALVQVTLVVFMLLWRPDVDSTWIIYVIPGFWGMGDAVWQTTTNSMIGTLFYEDRDSAFACFRLWQAAGLAAAFSYSHVLCTWVKLYVIAGALVLGVVTYYVMELWNRKRTHEQRTGYEKL